MVGTAEKSDQLELVISDILYLATVVVGTRTFFVTRLKNDIFEVSKILNNEGIDLEAGQTVSYGDSLCQYVNFENYREPFIVEDTSVDERLKDSWVTKELKIGSYLAIPIELYDGTLYGTLCAADPSRYSFNETEISDMNRLAGLLARVVDLLLEKPIDKASVIRSKSLSVVGELSADLADQIGNPLQIIKGFLKISISKNYLLKYQDLIESELEKIEKALSNYILQTSPQYPDRKKVNITNVISDLLHSMEVNKYSSIKFDMSVNLPLPGIVIDVEQIKFVLENIIMNAIESLKENSGFVHIRCYSLEDSIMIEVEDNGSGIPISDLQKINQPFYTTKDNAKGLGLTMTNRIIKGHDGEVTIESLPHGTKVSIKLPLTEVESI
ncbi:ATP-binding protein [Bacillus sp. AK128]